MESLRLALSLTRVPKLFATLFLVPLSASLLLVAAQLFITAAFLESAQTVSEKGAQELIQTRKDYNFGRKVLYGDPRPLPPVKICRWVTVTQSTGYSKELPPSETCAPKRLDVALLVPNPHNFDSTAYERIFNGNVETLHVCRSCKPDIVIHPRANGSQEMRADVLSIWGLIVLHLVRFDGTIQEQYLNVAKNSDQIDALIGDIYFNAYGLKAASRLTDSEKLLALIFNIASLIMIALWLAIRAHRRILDYFSKNGALLPMVAACGKASFYRALWLLTIFRVAAFLLATIPTTIVVFYSLFDETSVPEVLESLGTFDLALWLIAIVASFGMATMIASIGDLKQRHSLLSILYSLAPFLLATGGALIWALTFIGDGPALGHIRSALTALPIIGMAPTILAPKLQPYNWTLVIHAVMSLSVITVLLRNNTRWFAAHLEEL